MKDARRRVWIDPFQTQLFYRVGMYWLIYTFTLFNLLLVWRLLKEGPGNFWEQLAATGYDNIPLFVCLVIVTPWLGLDAVHFANRLVGPLFRFRKTMRAIAANEPVQLIRLRKGDFLLEMQDDFNAMLEALEQRGGVQLDDSVKPTTQMRR